MTTWGLLVRAINLGPRNKLAMADLRALLGDLGHTDVRTVLNSGNATFTSSRRSRAALTKEIEGQLRDRHRLDVGVTLRTADELQAAVDALPQEVANTPYAVISFLFDPLSKAAARSVQEWDVSPDTLVLGDGVVYIGYARQLHTSPLSNAALEKRLGGRTTARTPDTIRKLLG